MIPSTIAHLELIPLNLPMRQPFITALGKKRISRNLLVAIRLKDGTVGFGEASESLAWPNESQAAMTRALQQITPHLLGSDVRNYRRLSDEAWEMGSAHPTAIAALECALLDAFTRGQGLPLWRWFGKECFPVTTSLTISAWTPSRAHAMARRAFRRRFRHFKIKVTGRDLEEDLRRVIAVSNGAPKAFLILDGNQGFSPQQALQLISSLRQKKIPIRLFEQPVHRDDWEGLTRVEREGKIAVVADESARTVQQTLQLIRQKKVSVVNVKFAKSGLLGAVKIIRRAKAAGIRLMIGCMAESAIGLSPSVHFAAGSHVFDFVDLDSPLLVVSPPYDPGFILKGATFQVHPTRSGAGSLPFSSLS